MKVVTKISWVTVCNDCIRIHTQEKLQLISYMKKNAILYHLQVQILIPLLLFHCPSFGNLVIWSFENTQENKQITACT